MDEKEMLRHVSRFYRLLQKENKALVKDDGATLEQLVQEKEAYVPIFDTYSGPMTEAIINGIKKIQVLQEENLLLTQQAMSYQQAFMNTVQQELKKQQTPYQRATYPRNKTGSASIVDQRI